MSIMLYLCFITGIRRRRQKAWEDTDESRNADKHNNMVKKLFTYRRPTCYAAVIPTSINTHTLAWSAYSHAGKQESSPMCDRTQILPISAEHDLTYYVITWWPYMTATGQWTFPCWEICIKLSNARKQVLRRSVAFYVSLRYLLKKKTRGPFDPCLYTG